MSRAIINKKIYQMSLPEYMQYGPVYGAFSQVTGRVERSSTPKPGMELLLYTAGSVEPTSIAETWHAQAVITAIEQGQPVTFEALATAKVPLDMIPKFALGRRSVFGPLIGGAVEPLNRPEAADEKKAIPPVAIEALDNAVPTGAPSLGIEKRKRGRPKGSLGKKPNAPKVRYLDGPGVLLDEAVPVDAPKADTRFGDKGVYERKLKALKPGQAYLLHYDDPLDAQSAARSIGGSLSPIRAKLNFRVHIRTKYTSSGGATVAIIRGDDV